MHLILRRSVCLIDVTIVRLWVLASSTATGKGDKLDWDRRQEIKDIIRVEKKVFGYRAEGWFYSSIAWTEWDPYLC